MPPVASWKSTLPDDVLLDSAVLYINSAIFSGQRGGIKFDRGVEQRQIPFDGQRAPVKGLDRTVMFSPKFTGTILQVPVTALGVLEPGVSGPSGTISGGPTGATQELPKQAGVLYAAGDYIVNPQVIYYRGNGSYVGVRFYDGALCTKWTLAGQDKDEGLYEIEIEARLDLTQSGRQVSDCPYLIEYFSTLPS